MDDGPGEGDFLPDQVIRRAGFGCDSRRAFDQMPISLRACVDERLAGFLSAGANHWVGGQPTDANGLALMGWSRNGGDLRVAHFFALHAQQVIPVIGWGVVATRFRRARTAVVLASAAYVALIVFTFVQALQGEPFLAFLG
jgi:hypothetical protein